MEYIKIYGHETVPTSVGATTGLEFIGKVNPENIRTSRTILFNSDNRANTGVDIPQWQGYGAIDLQITLIITDNDGGDDRLNPKLPADGLQPNKVRDQIDKLLKATYDYISSIHKSPYVTVQWGDFGFIGHLKDLSIDYQIFDIDGNPTHAVCELSFVSFAESEEQARMQNRNSPDMTHMQLFKDGDKIPLICDKIYDDPNYYIQIAELNKLTNFRNIPSGETILFPPLIN